MRGTVLIADDHPMFAEGLASLLEFSDYLVVAFAWDGIEAIQKVQEIKPDIAILDVSMPRLSGIDAIEHIRQASPTTRVIMLTMNEEASLISQAVQAGADAYMLKNSSKTDLLSALDAVRSGKSYFSPGVAEALLQQELSRNRARKEPSSLPDEEVLTPREIAVAKLLVQDLTNAEIADKLHISIRTVEGHRMNILRKLDLKSIVGLTKYATQRGWSI